MENTARSMILTQPSLMFDDRTSKLTDATAGALITVSVKALYDLAVAKNTDPDTLTVNNQAAALAGKSLKDLYDEGVDEIEIIVPVKFMSAGA